MKDQFREEIRYKIGRHKNWLKTLTIKFPTIKKQQGVASELPLRCEHGLIWLRIPNHIGIKKVVYFFDYGKDYYKEVRKDA